MWGNTQTFNGLVEDNTVFRQGTLGQLVKISYARPESWHWMFSARALKGPANTPGFFTRLFVLFDLTIGVGRSVQQFVSAPGVFPFEQFIFKYGPLQGFPTGEQIYSSSAAAPNRNFDSDTPAVSTDQIDQVVAQDIQLSCRLFATTVVANVAAVGQPFSVEVSAAFAPKTHIRPEWHDKRFPGGEDGGGTSVLQQVQQLNRPGKPISRT